MRKEKVEKAEHTQLVQGREYSIKRWMRKTSDLVSSDRAIAEEEGRSKRTGEVEGKAADGKTMRKDRRRSRLQDQRKGTRRERRRSGTKRRSDGRAKVTVSASNQSEGSDAKHSAPCCRSHCNFLALASPTTTRVPYRIIPSALPTARTSQPAPTHPSSSPPSHTPLHRPPPTANQPEP